MGLRGEAKALGGLFIFGIFGIFMAIVAQQLNEKNIMIDEIVTATLTITDIMFVVFLLFCLLGLLYYFTRN